MKYAEFRTLETERLILRKLTMEDAPAYFRQLFGSAQVAKHMLWDPHRELAQSVAALEKLMVRYESGRCYRWGIVRKEDGALVGIFELLRFEEETGNCSFAYMLGEAFWGNGYATEAMKAAFGFAFAEMEVSSVTADHFAQNAASGAVMRKVGMRYVRTIPHKYEKHGCWHDAQEYTMTREAWNAKTRC